MLQMGNFRGNSLKAAYYNEYIQQWINLIIATNFAVIVIAICIHVQLGS